MRNTDYTPVSSAAVACATCAALSAGGFFLPLLAIAALPAIVFGCIALREIHEYGLVGRRLAIVGLPLSLTMAVGTLLLEGALFRSEAPLGYERIAFAKDLDDSVGQQVCPKGYSFGTETRETTGFMFSPNGSEYRGAFCIQVQLADGTGWKLDGGGIAVSGRLERLPVDDDCPYDMRYILKDAVVRPARTVYQIAPYSGGEC